MKKIIYLNSDDSSELEWETIEERNELVRNHPNSITYELEEFSKAFNSNLISDLGYTAISK